MSDIRRDSTYVGSAWIHGARCAFGPMESARASLEISSGQVARIRIDSARSLKARSMSCEIDLAGFLLMPGLINAHDHLQYALFPRLGNGPYLNYVEWGEDIHSTDREIIAQHRAVPKRTRLWWGGIRNVLCGVTTVCHHDSLWPELQRCDFPVDVVQRYGWAHSLALGGDLRAARDAAPGRHPFILHACEGVDDRARNEIVELESLGLLASNVVLVHGLALNSAGVAIMRRRQCSLVICPSSNEFLFGKLPDMPVLREINQIALGNDSPLTAAGDLLDEIRFATDACNIPAASAYHMVTQAPAALLRLQQPTAMIGVACPGNLIAVRDTGAAPADRLATMSMHDVELVVIRGQVQVASDAVLKRLPAGLREGLNPLGIDGTTRWVRAPIEALLAEAEDVLGVGQVRLGGRSIHVPTYAI